MEPPKEDIRHLYPKSLAYRFTILRLIRPIPGIFLINSHLQPETWRPQRDELYKAKSNAKAFAWLDSLIALVRYLLTLGYSRPDDQLKLIDTAWLNFGFQMNRDFRSKEILLRRLLQKLGLEAHISEIDQDGTLGSEDLFSRLLFEIVNCHDFAQICDDAFIIKKGTDAWQPFQIVKDLDSAPSASWDGKTSVEEHVNNRFLPFRQGTDFIQYFSKRPAFWKITYRSSGLQRFSALQSFRLKARTIRIEKDRWIYADQDTEYNLCAIINLEDRKVRTYWKDGTEIVPQKTESYTPEPSLWSVENQGSFCLIYYAVIAPEGWPHHCELEQFVREFECPMIKTESVQDIHSLAPVMPMDESKNASGGRTLSTAIPIENTDDD